MPNYFSEDRQFNVFLWFQLLLTVPLTLNMMDNFWLLPTLTPVGAIYWTKRCH